MTSSVSVKLTWDNQAIGSIENSAAKGLFSLGFDIAAQARRNAPYLTGALRNSIRVQEVSQNVVEVRAGGRFGGKNIPYAWIREQGPNRNPATEHYMENAQRAIMAGNYMQKYFGDITK